MGSARFARLAIDASHAVKLSFTSTNGPGGGEYISPAAVTTNAAGQAYHDIQCRDAIGCRAGDRHRDRGQRARSPPARSGSSSTADSRCSRISRSLRWRTISRHSHELGKIRVRSRYSPATCTATRSPPGTAVYFRSSAGVVQPSVFTDKNGFGTVNLYSGNPGPYALLRCTGLRRRLSLCRRADPRTGRYGGAGQHADALERPRRHQQCQSDDLRCRRTPARRSFSFRVSDELGHPLAAGTIISVSALDSAAAVGRDPAEPGQHGLRIQWRGETARCDLLGSRDDGFHLHAEGRDVEHHRSDTGEYRHQCDRTECAGSIGYTFGGTVR